MDYIYSVDLDSYVGNSNTIKTSDLCSSSLSNRNILAFSSDCCVYILPLEKPNELIPVNLNSSPSEYLAWSDDGVHLMNVCKNGTCNLYCVKANLLNTIDLVFSFKIIKDEFILVKSFSKLPKLCLDYIKQDSVNYFEKFSYSSFKYFKDLSVSLFSGFLILNKTGKLQLCFTDFNSVKKKYEYFEFDMKLQQNLIGNTMDCGNQANAEDISFNFGDFSYEFDGSINVAFTNADLSSPIYIFRVMISFNNDNSALEGTSELVATINLMYEPNMVKSRFLFMSNEMASTLCVNVTSEFSQTSSFQFWKASKDTHESLISQNTAWNCISTLQCESKISDIRISKNELNFKDHRNFERQDYKFFLFVAYINGQIGFIDTFKFSQRFLSPIPSRSEKPRQFERKKIKTSNEEYLVTLDQSSSGLVGVGITNQCSLVAFRQIDFKTSQSDSQPIQQLTNLYEYSLLSGSDLWDLIISTNPRFIDALIESLELNFSNQSNISIKKAYFSRFYSIIYALSRRSTTSLKNQSKCLDFLAKLTLNRSISIFSYSIQLNLNVDSLISLFSNSSSNFINTSKSVPLINTNLITTNLDYINNQTMPNSPANSFNQIPLKTNLNDYFSEILKLDSLTNTNLNELRLNDIVQSILNRKNTTIVVNCHLKHIAQWIIDMSLSLVKTTLHVYKSIKTGSISDSQTEHDIFAASLLMDYWFLNELRKGLLFVKILTSLNLANYPLPVLPYRSMGYQKDLLSELFSIITRLIPKINDRIAPIDESLMEQCILIQTDTIATNLDKKYFNLRHSWFGLSTSSWLKTFQFPVDYLFDEERLCALYPLFDIVKLIQFSRSSLTKQCIRCGNYTESEQNLASTSASFSHKAFQMCISMQDLCGNKCLCGGPWVFSPIQ